MTRPRLTRYLPTNKQIETLQAVARLTQEKSFAPSLAELGQASGLRSLASIAARVARLTRHGLLQREPFRPRTIRVTARGSLLI